MQFGTAALRRGAFGQPSVPFLLSRRAHLLTTARRAAVVSHPLVGPSALPEASAGCFSRGGRQCRSFANRRHWLCGWQTAFALFASSLQSVVLFRDNLPPACENLPPAALPQLWTMHPRHRPFSFVSAKETKPPLAGGRKEVKDYGDLSPGSKGRKPWRGSLRLRGFRLSKLFRYLQRL